MPATDLQAAQVLAQNLQADIDLAQRATAHSSDDRVKALAKDIVANQSHDLESLKSLERALGGGPPSTPKTAPAEQQDIGTLENAVGAEFDRLFLERLAHQLTDTRQMSELIADSSLGATVRDAARKITGELDAQLKQSSALHVP